MRSQLLKVTGIALALAAVAGGAGGCIGQVMSSVNPGLSPRDGELVRVGPVGGEQVQFVFRFKAGPDPQPASPASAGEPGEPRRTDSPDQPGPPGQPGQPDQPAPPEDEPVAPAPLPPAPGVTVRVAEVLLNDRRGQSFGIVDQDIRRLGNVYYLTITSAAVSPETYHVVCQVHVVVGGFQLKMATAASREVDRWQADFRSFKFAVYGATERRPWWQFNLLGRR